MTCLKNVVHLSARLLAQHKLHRSSDSQLTPFVSSLHSLLVALGRTLALTRSRTHAMPERGTGAPLRRQLPGVLCGAQGAAQDQDAVVGAGFGGVVVSKAVSLAAQDLASAPLHFSRQQG